MVRLKFLSAISGSVTVSGVSATVAHIHDAPAGKNGPIVIPLVKNSDTVWAVPAGTKLTDAQHESYRAGNLYFNIHSATYKAGDIRGQIKPQPCRTGNGFSPVKREGFPGCFVARQD